MQAFQEQTEEGRSPWSELLSACVAGEWPWLGRYAMAVIDLAVCADESGIHEGAPLCILSGYIASVDQWLWFDDRWNAVLERADVADFHSKEFFALGSDGERVGRYRLRSDRTVKGSYGDWSDARANQFLADLLEAIHQSRIHPLGSYVPTSDFFSFSYGERKYLTGGKFDVINGKLKWRTSGAASKPYFLVYDHCIAEAILRTKVGGRTLFVFDQQKQFENRAVQQFAESMTAFAHYGDKNVKGKYGGVIFHERFDVPGLQAADMYTHCWYRYVAGENKSGPRYAALDRLTDKVPGMKFYTTEHLSGLFRNMPSNVRNAVHEWSEEDDH